MKMGRRYSCLSSSSSSLLVTHSAVAVTVHKLLSRPTNAQHIYIYIYRVPQEECARIREGVPYVKVYRYNPKHLCPKLNGYGDNDQRSLKL